MTLHHCGAENAEEAKFCSGCGERIGPPATAAKKSCPQCRFENDAGARFCAECGTAFAVPAAAVRPATAASGRRRAPFVAVVALVAVLAGGAGWWALGSPASEEAELVQTAAPAAKPKAAASKPTTRPVSAADERRQAASQIAPSQVALGARSPREACASSSNAITRFACETAKCNEPAYKKHAICVEYSERERKQAELFPVDGNR